MGVGREHGRGVGNTPLGKQIEQEKRSKELEHSRDEEVQGRERERCVRACVVGWVGASRIACRKEARAEGLSLPSPAPAAQRPLSSGTPLRRVKGGGLALGSCSGYREGRAC